jgi:hypothetical protein
MNASDVLNRLTFHKLRQGPFLDYLEKVDGKLASQVAGCGSWLHVREWELSGESRLRNANFCKRFLICPCCAARRAAKLVTAYAAKVAVIQDMNPGLIPCMITLTIKNGPNLRERLVHLRASWSRMVAANRKGKLGKERHAAIEWNKVAGSIKAIEAKIGKGSGLWHPHIHAFALVTEDISKFHLSAEWERFTGDSIIVHISPCDKGIVPGLIEVLKYVSKPSELSPELLFELYESAKGSRFVDPQGCLRGVPEPCIDSDDDDGLHGPFRDFIALWSRGSYSLQSVGHRLDILRPGDAGYGAPREIVYLEPGSPEWDSGIALPPERATSPREAYVESWDSWSQRLLQEPPGGPMASLPA